MHPTDRCTIVKYVFRRRSCPKTKYHGYSQKITFKYGLIATNHVQSQKTMGTDFPSQWSIPRKRSTRPAPSNLPSCIRFCYKSYGINAIVAAWKQQHLEDFSKVFSASQQVIFSTREMTIESPKSIDWIFLGALPSTIL